MAGYGLSSSFFGFVLDFLFPSLFPFVSFPFCVISCYWCWRRYGGVWFLFPVVRFGVEYSFSLLVSFPFLSSFLFCWLNGGGISVFCGGSGMVPPHPSLVLGVVMVGYGSSSSLFDLVFEFLFPSLFPFVSFPFCVISCYWCWRRDGGVWFLFLVVRFGVEYSFSLFVSFLSIVVFFPVGW